MNLQREDLTPEDDLRNLSRRVLGESSLPDLSHGLSFQKNKNNQAKNLPEDFTRFSFFTILISPRSKIILFSFLLKNIIIS